LGEGPEEVLEALRDLRTAGVQLVTIGQYLKPDPDCLPVSTFIRPEEFEHYREEAKRIGFLEVASGTFVRSSYNAAELYREASILSAKSR
jgi:lipoic acid synthetase